ncbi:hypothetical protein ACTWP5_28605 [Streptomyces sp. 4N509B]|uniref:hypothetical protein n=1 Tax=Streptomyces sp. 4N509B TaxID=3457413 RepID=UPI003FD45694
MVSALQDVLIRTNDDPQFRSALLDGDSSVLGDYQLSLDEVTAIIAGDEDRLYRLLDSTKYFHLRENGNYGDDGDVDEDRRF